MAMAVWRQNWNRPLRWCLRHVTWALGALSPRVLRPTPHTPPPAVPFPPSHLIPFLSPPSSTPLSAPLQDLVPGGGEVVSLLPPEMLAVGRSNFLELAKDSNVSDFQALVFK